MRRILLAIAILGAVFTAERASAATFPLGTLDPTPVDSAILGRQVAVGSFEDIYSFSVSAAANTAATVVQLVFGSVLNIDRLGLALYENDTLPGSILVQPPGGTNPIELSYSGLQTGITYFLVVTGIGSGSSGGLYSGALSVSAVPLPPALLLLGSALVGLAAVSRRSKRPTA